MVELSSPVQPEIGPAF